MFKTIVNFLLLFITILFFGCIDPVEPEFEFKEGLVFIEGIATTDEGSSFVIINKSVNEFGINKTAFESGAVVSFVNAVTGQTVLLQEVEEAYVPANDFRVNAGEKWELEVTLLDGKQYRSQTETVLNPVEIEDIKATYNTELRFSEGTGSFEPGHEIAISFTDPESEENYYYWTFKSFEKLRICNTCFDGILRENNCVATDVTTPEYFNYFCDTECWKIRFPESISLFDDKFSNGTKTSNLKVADIPLYTKESIVVEIQQFSLTPSAYNYYKVLKDIVDNNSGFNAPPPAALIGNLFNPNDSDDFVFGRFTTAATSTSQIFIERGSIEEDEIENQRQIVVEPTFMSPYPPPATIEAPCEEGRFRTAIQPEAWMN
jgi:hypothetical protein